MGMWNEMELHLDRYRHKYARKPIDKPAITFEVSPAVEESENWSMEDWSRFCWEFVHELDKVNRVKYKGRYAKVKPTNMANTQFFAGLHRDSESGILHLHLLCNRIDMTGNMNDARLIGLRAVAAADAINLRRGWKDPMEIHREHVAMIVRDCMDALRNMDRFSWEGYVDAMLRKGYATELRRDSKGEVVGYTVRLGHSHFKASELGTDRKLMARKIERT